MDIYVYTGLEETEKLHIMTEYILVFTDPRILSCYIHTFNVNYIKFALLSILL